MTTSSKVFGHDAYFDKEKGEWFFTRNNEPVYKKTRSRNITCPRCGSQPNETDDYDPCLGKLPGVKYACCGHGVENGYIVFENGVTLRGKFTIEKETDKELWSQIGNTKFSMISAVDNMNCLNCDSANFTTDEKTTCTSKFSNHYCRFILDPENSACDSFSMYAPEYSCYYCQFSKICRMDDGSRTLVCSCPEASTYVIKNEYSNVCKHFKCETRGDSDATKEN